MKWKSAGGGRAGLSRSDHVADGEEVNYRVARDRTPMLDNSRRMR